MWNKYCKKLNIILEEGFGAYHNLRKLVDIREDVEHNIWCRLSLRNFRFYVDNWTRKGALYFSEGENSIEEEIKVKDISSLWWNQWLRSILGGGINGHLFLTTSIAERL